MARPSVTVLAVLTAVAVVGLSVAADASSAAGAAACYNGPPAVVVNEGADVYLGVLINMREMDEDDVGKCSVQLHREAVELYESLRWYLALINQDSGQVASRIVKASFIPGIKLGLKIFDACGDGDLAERQLNVLFPELADEEEQETCEMGEQSPMIGLVDFVGLTDEPEISQQLHSFSIPFMAVRLDDFLPAEEVAEALVQFTRQLMWDRVSVVYADDEYSMSIARRLSRRAEAAGVCFDAFSRVTDLEAGIAAAGTTATAVLVVAPPEEAQNLTDQLTGAGHQYQWLFSQPWAAENTDLLEELTRRGPVFGLTVAPIVVDQFEEHWNSRKNPKMAVTAENLPTLQYLANAKKCYLAEVTDGEEDWLPCHNFNVPETELGRVLRNTRVLPAVHVINTFASAFRKAWDMKCVQQEGYCQDLRQMTRLQFYQDIFQKLELEHAGPGNRIPPGFIGWRDPSNNQISDVKFSLIHASATPGDDLMVDEVFSFKKELGVTTVDKSFVPTMVRCPRAGCTSCVAFREGRGEIDVADQDQERPRPHQRAGPQAPVQEADSYQPTDSSETLEAEQDLPEPDEAEEGQEVDDVEELEEVEESDLEPEVPGQHLDDFESSESIVSVHKLATDGRNSVGGAQQVETIKVVDEVYVDEDEPRDDSAEIPVESDPEPIVPQGIIIPALFPVHRPGPTPLQCSADVNPETIQDIEAFLWALDHVNENADLLSGLEIGAVIFDTCSSPIKAAHLVSSVLAKEGDPMLDEVSINPDRLVTIVSVASSEETEAAASVLAQAGLTTVSAKDRGDSLTAAPHQLQVEVPMSVAARAVLELLTFYGVTYVSVVYSANDPDSLKGFRHFERLAENTEICIGLVERLNRTSTGPVLARVMGHLTAKMDMGSRVVVLWTEEADTQALLSQLNRLSPQESEVYKQLVWISASGWSNAGPINNFGRDVGHWLAVRPQLKLVNEFAVHFSKLRPENNERNPWFAEYWEQMNECPTGATNADCQSRNGRISLHTTTVIQSVYAIASALARMIQERCPEGGADATLCTNNTIELRDEVFNYLHMTGTDRPGDVDGEFGFTDQGYGDTPIEIVAIDAGPSEFSLRSVGTYREDSGLQLSETVGLASIVSECSSTRREICAGCLSKQQNQVLVKNSKDKLYVMGLFDVREHNVDGLWSCGTNVTAAGIQQTEAFLWALEQVNADPQLLPGVQLGGVGLDGCGTHEKRTTEMARVFSSPSLAPGLNGNHVVGLVVGTTDADPRAIFDLHARHRLPVVLAAPGLEMTTSNSPLLQLGPSVSIIGYGLVNLLTKFNWTYVSTICSSQVYPYNAVCEEFQNAATKQGISFAVDAAVSDNQHVINYWENMATMILNKGLNGGRVLVVLAPEAELVQLLTALRKQKSAMIVSEPVVLVTLGAEKLTSLYTDVLSAVVTVRARQTPPGRFFENFVGASFRVNTANPWLMKYWTQQFKCRGAACQNLSLSQARTPPVRDPAVSNTIDGVLAIAYGLEHVRKELCPQSPQGACEAMYTTDLRRRVERAILEQSFRDINGNHVTFTSSGVSDDAGVEVLVAYQPAVGVRAEMVKAGVYSTRGGLALDTSKTKARDWNSTTIALTSVASQCLNCQQTKTHLKSWQPSQFMQVTPKIKPGFTLLGLLPFHRQGLKPLSCGTMHSTRVFQNLAAVAWALERLHVNQTLPHSLQIGAVLFDSCGRIERAQQRLLSFLSDNSTQVLSSSVIGAITMEGETASAVANVLSEANIRQVSLAIDGFRTGSEATAAAAAAGSKSKDPRTWTSVGATGAGLPLQTVPSVEDEVRAMFDVVRSLAWKHVILFYDDSASGAADRDLWLHLAAETSVCVGAQIRVNKFGRGEAADLHSLLEAIESDLPALSVAVLLLDTPAQVLHVLTVLHDVGLAKRFIVVSNQAWGHNQDLLFEAPTRQLAGVLTVAMETRQVAGFDQFLAGLTLEKHSTVPDDWFHEYFQHFFECHLVNSPVLQKMYPRQCTGNERIDARLVEQDPYVYHTVLAVETFARALREFLQSYCTAGLQATQLSDCGANSLERFQAVFEDTVQRGLSEDAVRGLVVWNVQLTVDKQATYESVGRWRRQRLELDRAKMKFYVPYTSVPTVECLQGSCLSVCASQSVLSTSARSPQQAKLPEVPTNFGTAWGVVAVIFCVLGLTAVVAVFVYFSRHLQKPTPMSVLSYLILAGIALLYLAIIFNLLHPTEVSCGLRRFFLGISYTLIFGGLLVRSVYAWRRITRGDATTAVSPFVMASSSSTTSSFENNETTKPPALVLTTLTLVAIQVILLAAWLIFKPPLAMQTLSGQWRCSPAESFESELVTSLALPLILLFTAAVFSVVVWRSSDAPKDSRATMACNILLSFITIIWTLVATQSSFRFRDPAIVVGNLLCAKVLLLVLYGRKVYDIAVRRQEARNLAVLSQFTSTKTLQPNLQAYPNNRVYHGEGAGEHPHLSLPESGYAAGAEDAAMGLCLGLATGHLSRSGSRKSSIGRRDAPASPTGSYHEELFDQQVVPCPVYPNGDRMSCRSTRSLELSEERELSDGEEYNSRYRAYGRPQSRRGSLDLSRNLQPPMVRRIGSRQMLVLGDEASIHGRVSRI